MCRRSSFGYGFPHVHICFCYRSSFTTVTYSYHLTFTSSLLVLAAVVQCLQVRRLKPLIGLVLLCFLYPQGRTLHCETMWQVPPFPTGRCSPSAAFSSCCHIQHLPCLCVQQVRWYRTPVSFMLSRCFTWDIYQNIETSWKPQCLSCWGMPGHVMSEMQSVL